MLAYWSVVPGVRIELTTKRYECLVLPLELTGLRRRDYIPALHTRASNQLPAFKKHAPVTWREVSNSRCRPHRQPAVEFIPEPVQQLDDPPFQPTP